MTLSRFSDARGVIAAGAILLLQYAASAGSAPGKPAATYTVQLRPFVLEVTASGHFEPVDQHPIAVSPELWSELVIEDVIAPGTKVRRGDLLIRLATDHLDEAIRNLEADGDLANHDLLRAEAELRLLEASTSLDLVLFERSLRVATENRELFRNVNRDLSEKWARHDVRRATDSLAYEREELKQLEQMYRADDLTEETEEIILKRQRDVVDRLTFYLESQRIRSQQRLDVELPREAEDVDLQERQKTQALERAKTTLPMTLQRRRLELEKRKFELFRNAEKLARWRADRERLRVTAPADGIVFYGRFENGVWVTADAAKYLHRGVSIPAHQVLLTVAAPRPVQVRALLPEAARAHLQQGLSGTATPSAWPDLDCPVSIETISAAPVKPGFFDLLLRANPGNDARLVMPGMACRARFTPYRQHKAVSVPDSAVFPDEWEHRSYVVYIRQADGSSERRGVEIGQRCGGRTEILKGLAAGETIFLSRPADAP